MSDSPKKDWKDKLRELAEKASNAWTNSGIPRKAGEMAEKYRLRERFVSLLPQDLARSMPRTMEPMAMAEWLGQAFQRQGSAFYGRAITIVICAYFLADVAALMIKIPEPPVARTGMTYRNERRIKGLDDYNVIYSRNIFNSEGRIPGEETGPVDNGGAPVKSSLPLNLIGTLILRDELRSIATIEDKSASTVYPVRIDDEIPSKIRVLKVEPRRVIFINTSSGRREFIELPEDPSATNPRITLGGPKFTGGGGAGIERVSPTQFSIARNEVDKTLSNLNEVLTQARCVPNFEGGVAAGYKCFQIVPGSIYDKLGMQNGDVICGINGQTPGDPGEAFKMLNELKTSSHLELCIKRDGRQMQYAYDIH